MTHDDSWFGNEPDPYFKIKLKSRQDAFVEIPGLITTFLKLLSHNELSVKQTAIKILGHLASVESARNTIGTTSTLLQLISCLQLNTKDNLLEGNALMTLHHLCNSHTSAARLLQINELGGLKVLCDMLKKPIGTYLKIHNLVAITIYHFCRLDATRQLLSSHQISKYLILLLQAHT